MSSRRNGTDGRRSVALKLALFYALFFGLASGGSGALLYHLVRGHVIGEIDQDMGRQAAELTRTLADEGLDALGRDITATVEAGGKDDYFIRLLDAAGGVVLTSDTSGWPQLPAYRPEVSPSARSALGMLELPDARGRARVLTVPLGEDRYLQLGASLADSDAFLSHVEHYGLIVLATLLTLGSLVGWGLAREAMAGVESVTRAAERIADGHFSDRVDAAGHGREIDDLVITFNRMAERVQSVMQEMRQVNDNIAHDLRSPLTRIRGLAEAAVMDRTLCGEGAEMAGSIVEECDRLMQLINTLLDIAETEAGVRVLRLEDVDLAQLAAQAVELFAGVAEDKGVALASAASGSPVARGDRRRLQRALSNLVDNAIKYTPPGGRVGVSVSSAGTQAAVAVSDTGPGIAAADLPRLFERFYRGDRARNLPGNGLGLALALAVAHAHGGDIDVRTGADGSTFTLRLPMRAVQRAKP
jgi:signal transduction histidine kinase